LSLLKNSICASLYIEELAIMCPIAAEKKGVNH
jgi:hypothetical protein